MWIELDNYVTNDFLESLLHRLLKHSILKYSWIKVSSQMKMKGLNTQHWMTQVSNEWGQWALNMRTRWGCDGPRLGEWGWRRTWGVTSIPKEHGSVTSRPLRKLRQTGSLGSSTSVKSVKSNLVDRGHPVGVGRREVVAPPVTVALDERPWPTKI